MNSVQTGKQSLSSAYGHLYYSEDKGNLNFGTICPVVITVVSSM